MWFLESWLASLDIPLFIEGNDRLLDILCHKFMINLSRRQADTDWMWRERKIKCIKMLNLMMGLKERRSEDDAQYAKKFA